jgi:SAM-dependent MidA family methyltransferase
VNDALSEGFVLTIDYGYPAWDYYSEERNRGTLLCYREHQVCEDPYQNIGDQDITAHVNFTSLKKWGEELGFRTLGFCPQGTYLISLGIDEVITELYGDSPDPFDIARIRGLILPQGMGESHKVMILYKGKGNPALRGFDLRNQVRNL